MQLRVGVTHMQLQRGPAFAAASDVAQSEKGYFANLMLTSCRDELEKTRPR